MNEAQAYTLLVERLKVAAEAVNLEIAFKDVEFSQPPEEYLLVDYFPNEPSNRMISSGRERFVGIFQIMLVTTEQIGAEPRYETARQVADFYVKGESLFGAAGKIKIFKKPWLANAMRDDKNLRIPITVEYEFFA